MKVLMLDEGIGLGGLVESDLIDAGHEVLRCHPWGQPDFPCVGLLDRELCPLEHSPVGVAVKLSEEGSGCPGHHEQGVVCSLRRRVPLVLAGASPDSTLVGLAAAITPGHEDVVGVVEAVADADITELSTIARAATLGVFERHGLTHADIDGWVVRRDDGLIARLVADEDVPRSVREVAAIKVHAELKRLAPDAAAISVSVISADEADRAAAR